MTRAAAHAFGKFPVPSNAMICLLILWFLLPTGPAVVDACPPDTDPTTCFIAYQERLDELLTLDEIRAEHTAGLEQAKHEYAKNLPLRYQASQYTWPSDRSYTVKMGTQEITVAKPNRIGVGSLSAYGEKVKDPKASFLREHRTPTAEELAYLREKLQEKMEEEDMTTTQQKAGHALSDTLGSKIQFVSVDGLGDAAAWDVMDSALVILAGRVKFKVIADISDDQETNLALARKLAAHILRKC